MKKLLVSSLMIIIGLIGCTSTATESVDDTNIDLSISSMLVLALEDEYKAKATYEVIISEYGTITPFSNIVNAEQTHIDLLLPLFDTYQIELPDPVDKATLFLPESISNALALGIQAEIDNIALYEAFLKTDIPDDIRDAFEKLMGASENHLQAFTRAYEIQ
jgi:hypothetical protein